MKKPVYTLIDVYGLSFACYSCLDSYNIILNKQRGTYEDITNITYDCDIN